MTTSRTQWKALTKPYPSTALDLAIEDKDINNSSFNANNVYEWNIDGKSEYNIMHMSQHMTMVCTAYQTAHESSEEAITNIIVSGFTGQLKGWWDHYLTEAQKLGIFSAIKIDDNGEPIFNNGETILDAVNTLIFTIAQHFIGDPSLWKDRSVELLSNLKCKTLGDFKWYKDTFLTRVFTREDSQQPFWKENFLAGLPRSLGDKVRDKIRTLTPDNIIPYDHLCYGQLISFVQKTALEIFQNDKLQRQLAKEKTQNRKELGTFCEQFGLPGCSKQKTRKSVRHDQPSNTHYKQQRHFRNPKRRNQTSTREPKIETKLPQGKNKSIVCYNCKKPGHISKYCRLKRRISNLNLEPELEEQINSLLVETSEEDSLDDYSGEDIHNVQQDDEVSSSDNSDTPNINVLTKELNLLSKNLIRPSKSPWSCAAFYVNKQAELERETPRLVINYKPLNQTLRWIRYPIPNKKYLLNRLHSAKIFSKFDMKSDYWQIQIQEEEHFIPNLNNIIKPLHDRLKKNPPSWSNNHTTSVKHVKQLVKNLPCLSLPIPQAFKIVETYASDLVLASTKGRGKGSHLALTGPTQSMGSSTPALLYRIQYKVMNTCNSRVLLKTNDRETTLFVTDMTKANVAVPKLIFDFCRQSSRTQGFRTCHIMGFMLDQTGGHMGLNFNKKYLFNHIERSKRFKIKDGDVVAALSYLQGKADNDPLFFSRYMISSEGQLKHLFWADGTSKSDFQCFGDVLVFDSTYKKNKYNKPLVIFSGKNHHAQTIIFGCAIVSDESIEAYRWVMGVGILSKCNVK
uniref:Protein FAR-RED IMPAIRED RESPONSE 1 n=1 Tax=Cajanus cajan TaxID=3821 RepID=A0A151RUG7_CAJCA|nr:Protein FAR-RED IMPAIRED RESPONSE 1 [Cajanus cajan]